MTKKKTVTRRKASAASGQPIRHAVRSEFYEAVAEVIRSARSKAYRAVNFTMVESYWNVGRMIVEEEQQGKERAEYGAFLIKNLSIRLTEEFGKGFTEPNLWNFRQFYFSFPIWNAPRSKSSPRNNRENTSATDSSDILYALRRELTWTHYRLLMRVEKPDARYMVYERSRRSELEHSGTWNGRSTPSITSACS